MKLQFDGEVTDIELLQKELINKGYEIISIETSRWIGYNEDNTPNDRGGRIDIEVSDDHILPEKRKDLLGIEIEMINSDKTTVVGNIKQLEAQKYAIESVSIALLRK